ncbi:hypothetical protein JHD48_08195, partial [Sulfurimonas sp. SAG-AH-194-I05]
YTSSAINQDDGGYTFIVAGTTTDFFRFSGTDSVSPTITQIYDRFKEVNATAFKVAFKINDTSRSDLILSLIQSSTNIANVTLTDGSIVTTKTLANSEYNNIDLNLSIEPLSNQRGIIEYELQIKDASNNQVSEHFRVILDNKNHYHSITSKITSSSYDSASSDTVNDNRYTLATYTDFSDTNNYKVVEYKRHEIVNNTIINEYQVKDINSLVTYTTPTVTVPNTLKFQTPTEYLELSSLFSQNNMDFTFSNVNSSSQEVYVKYLTEVLNIQTDFFSSNTTYNTMSEFITEAQKNEISYGLLRSYDKTKFITLGINNNELIEYNQDGTRVDISLPVGTYTTTVVNSTEVLILNPQLDGVPHADYPHNIAFVLESDKKIKLAEYYAVNDTYSYTLLNKVAKDELYSSLSPNPKITTQLNKGYTYVSLSESLCENTSDYTWCDQDNNLSTVFGSNAHIEIILKFGKNWQYWKNNLSLEQKAAYIIPNFGSINNKEGVLIRTNASTTIDIPFNEDETSINDYTNLFPEGWILMSNNKKQTVEEISTSLSTIGETLKYVLLLRNDTWYIYAPTNNNDISNTIPRLSEVQRFESFWVYFF